MLTPAQRELLDVLSYGPRYAVNRTAVVKTLLRLGLIAPSGILGGYTITNAGLAALRGGDGRGEP